MDPTLLENKIILDYEKELFYFLNKNYFLNDYESLSVINSNLLNENLVTLEPLLIDVKMFSICLWWINTYRNTFYSTNYHQGEEFWSCKINYSKFVVAI